MKVQWKELLSRSILLSGAMGVMLCIFEPFQLYFTNINEYWFDIYNLFPVCLMMFTGVFGLSMISFLIAFLLHRKLWKIAFVIYGIVFVCTYIQGNYLAGNLPVLDGNSVDWQKFDYQRTYTIILWSAVLIITGILLWKKKSDFTVRFYCVIASIILAVLVVTCLITGISNDGFVDKGDLTITADGLYEYSKEGKNYVILLVDSVRGQEMTELLERDESLREKFKDFTYYDNTMAGYPLTFYSLYYIMSGDWYECDEYVDDYKENILLRAPLFGELEKRGYSLGMYTLEIPYVDDDGLYRFQNFKRAQGKFDSFFKVAKLELRLVGLKYAPYDLKRRCMALPGEFDERKTVEDIDDELYSLENDFFIQHLQDEVEYIDGNVFKLVHFEGAHVPNFYNKDLERQNEETDYAETVEAATAMTVAYLDKLKEAGVYDNAAIIVLSDHGYNEDPIDGYYYNPFGRQQSILFLKGFGEDHEELQISNAPIAHGDLPDAYIKLMDGNRGDAVFSFKQGDYRARRFLWHMNDNALHLEEYIQTGQAGDMDTMIKTGRVYEWPDGLVSE